jgi:RNA polymerase sigma-70 factor (ECF subfamily)
MRVVINVRGAKYQEAEYRDHQGFEQYCIQTWPRLYQYVYRRVQNRQEAEDVTQETHIRVLARFSSPENPPSLSYLKTTASNLIRDRWRCQEIHGREVPLEPLEETWLIGNNNTEDQIGRDSIQELMAKLSQEQRMVLQLRIVEGYSRAETAKMMGRSQDAVRGLQYRAVHALRGLMNQELKEVDH